MANAELMKALGNYITQAQLDLFIKAGLTADWLGLVLKSSNGPIKLEALKNLLTRATDDKECQLLCVCGQEGASQTHLQLLIAAGLTAKQLISELAGPNGYRKLKSFKRLLALVPDDKGHWIHDQKGKLQTYLRVLITAGFTPTQIGLISVQNGGPNSLNALGKLSITLNDYCSSPSSSFNLESIKTLSPTIFEFAYYGCRSSRINLLNEFFKKEECFSYFVKNISCLKTFCAHLASIRINALKIKKILDWLAYVKKYTDPPSNSSGLSSLLDRTAPLPLDVNSVSLGTPNVMSPTHHDSIFNSGTDGALTMSSTLANPTFLPGADDKLTESDLDLLCGGKKGVPVGDDLLEYPDLNLDIGSNTAMLWLIRACQQQGGDLLDGLYPPPFLDVDEPITTTPTHSPTSFFQPPQGKKRPHSSEDDSHGAASQPAQKRRRT